MTRVLDDIRAIIIISLINSYNTTRTSKVGLNSVHHILLITINTPQPLYRQLLKLYTSMHYARNGNGNGNLYKSRAPAARAGVMMVA